MMSDCEKHSSLLHKAVNHNNSNDYVRKKMFDSQTLEFFNQCCSSYLWQMLSYGDKMYD